jgi:osmotically-inducible protein OsmY
MAGFGNRVKEFIDEHELADEISAELSYDQSIVGADGIDVSTAEGVVTLEGEVDSLAQRWAVERAVRRIAGVRDVNNDLVVLPPAKLSRSDDEIEGAVQTVLSWTATIPGGINATVSNGLVSLEGTVGFRFQAEAAENAVRQLIGVRGVQNNLVVATAEAAQDIKTAIGAAIRRRVDHPADIEVVFDDGTVTLRGRVNSWAERRDAEESAELAPGVRNVIDEIRVQPDGR